MLQKFARGSKWEDHLAIGVVHMTMGRSGFLYSTWIRNFLCFGLRLHVQESIGPEDVGPDYPGICQRGCYFPRKNNGVLTIDGW